MTHNTDYTVAALRYEDFDRYVDQLAKMYHEAVTNGAVMSQSSGFTIDQALEYWLSLRHDLQNTRKILLIAFASTHEGSELLPSVLPK